MLARLRAVEEEEAERRKQKRIRKMEQDLYQEKLKSMKRAEMEAERLKMTHFKMINSKRLYTSQLDYDFDLQGEAENELSQTMVAEDELYELGIPEEELDI
jgi:hypothetical protein